jgi:antitoxin StbD
VLVSRVRGLVTERIVEESQDRLVAVLSQPRPVYYMVLPELIAQMAELRDERQLPTLLGRRVKSAERSVKVNVDEL